MNLNGHDGKFNFDDLKKINLHQKCSTRVDAVHQIVTFHIGFQCWRHRNGTGIVHQNVDSTELFNGTLNCRPHLILVTNVDNARQRFSAGFLN